METMLENYAETEGVDRLQNVYFGTSITGFGDARERDRIFFLELVHRMGFKTVLSMEPLIHDPAKMLDAAGGINWLDWIIIGGQTKPTIPPDEEWINEIMRENQNIPVFVKDNTLYPMINKEFPADLLPIAQAWGKVRP